MLNIQLRRINLERRRSNHSEVQELFKGCVDRAATGQPGLATELSIKYARYLRLAVNDHSAAIEVLNEALVRPQPFLCFLKERFPMKFGGLYSTFLNNRSVTPRTRSCISRCLTFICTSGQSIRQTLWGFLTTHFLQV